MGNFNTRIRNSENRRRAASRLIQIGVGNLTSAEIVRKLPARLVGSLADALDYYGDIHECDFIAEGKPLSIAEEDYRDAAEQLAGTSSATTI